MGRSINLEKYECLVFGGDAGSAGGADGGGTVGAVVSRGRHEDGAAGNDVV